jgi:hypothetical protein
MHLFKKPSRQAPVQIRAPLQTRRAPCIKKAVPLSSGPRSAEPHQRHMPTTDHDLALASELDPPPQPVKKDKKWRKHPRPGAQKKRGPPRPYRRLEEEVLNGRITKLTARMDKAKAQHEEAQQLLLRYTHERAYRAQDKLAASEEEAKEPEKPTEAPPPAVGSA